MSDERRSDLERAVDAALREMAGGEGPADMRRRVLARLEEPSSPARAWWAGLGAAAAAAVVVAIAFLRAGTPSPERPAPLTRASAQPALVAPAAEAPATPAVAPVRTARRDDAAVRRPAERPSAEAERNTDTVLAVDPIELAPLSVPPIGKETRIAVAALAFDRVEVAPLSEPEP